MHQNLVKPESAVRKAREYLQACGYEDHDIVTVSWKRGTAPMDNHGCLVSDAPAFIATKLDFDVYISAVTLFDLPPHGKRGKIEGTERVPALWADLDMKGGDTGFHNLTEINGVVDELSGLLGQPPAVRLRTGGGLHPRWPLVGDASAEDVYRWGALVQRVCEAHGKSADSVYDLARILRAPGTVNHKLEGNPRKTMLKVQETVPIHIDDLRKVLDKAEIPVLASEVGSGEKVFDPEQTDRYEKYAESAVEECIQFLQSLRGLGADDRLTYGTKGLEVGWEQGTWQVAERFVRLAHADWNSLTLDQLEPIFLANAPTDAKWKAKANQGKWNGAAKKNPPLPPAELPKDVSPGQSRILRGDRDEDGRPSLNVSNEQNALRFLERELGTGATAGVLRRCNDLVRTPRIGEDGYIAPPTVEREGRAIRPDDGPFQILMMDGESLASKMSMAYSCYKESANAAGHVTRRKVNFPVGVARLASKGIDGLTALRPLNGTTHTPIMRPDGTVLDTPGYDDETGYLYLPDADINVDPIPDQPTTDQVKAARDLLLLMVDGFPFPTDDYRMNYLGLLITPLLRFVAPPAYKMGLITAPKAGSGKTLLANILRVMHGGVFRAEVPSSDDEWNKSIASILDNTTAPVVHLDNVRGTIKSSVLEGVLTSADYGIRRLGQTSEVKAKNDRLWVVTGNNVTIGGDLHRRILSVEINANDERPQFRTDFKIKDLEGWVYSHRSEIIHALLTLVRAWQVAGQPTRGARTSESYGRWVEVVDGIFHLAGVPGQFDASTTEVEVPREEDEWAVFLKAVRKTFGKKVWTARQVMDTVDMSGPNEERFLSHEALPLELQEKYQRASGSLAGPTKSLGMWLRNRKEAYHDGLKVVEDKKNRAGTLQWRVLTIEEAPSTSNLTPVI